MLDGTAIKKGHNLHYRVQCIHCKKIFLKAAHTFGKCKCQCNKARLGAYNFKGYGNLSMNYYKRLRINCEKRKHEFSVSIKFLWELYEKQDGKCALSGADIPMLRNRKTKEHREYQLASLDRIDSSVGYIESNVQWVHKDVNLMKNKFDQEYFINTCKKIITHEITKNKSAGK